MQRLFSIVLYIVLSFALFLWTHDGLHGFIHGYKKVFESS